MAKGSAAFPGPGASGHQKMGTFMAHFQLNPYHQLLGLELVCQCEHLKVKELPVSHHRAFFFRKVAGSKVACRIPWLPNFTHHRRRWMNG